MFVRLVNSNWRGRDGGVVKGGNGQDELLKFFVFVDENWICEFQIFLFLSKENSIGKVLNYLGYKHHNS